MNKNTTKLADIILYPDSIIPYYSDGSWSLYNLISHVLDYTGPADIKISSFSISEPALRTFLEEFENNRINSLSLLFDISIPQRKFDLMLFAHTVFSEIRLCNNHSKAILIKSKSKQACIIGSQNLTPNPRLECGAIFTDDPIYSFYNTMFDNYFVEAIPFNPYDKK